MKHVIIMLVATTLSACASTSTVPATVTVKVPVPVSCVVPDVQKPSFAVDYLTIGSDSYTQTKALLAERIQRIGYENDLEAVIKSLKSEPSSFDTTQKGAQ